MWMLQIKHERAVSSDSKHQVSGLNKQGRAELFQSDLEVLGNQMKHSFKCLILLLTALIIPGEIESKLR